MSRIEKLRKEVFLKSSFSDYYYYLFYKEYDRIASLPEEDRYVEAFYSAFSNLTPSISEGELIVGKRDVPMSAEEQTEWDNAYKNIALNRKNKAGGGQDSHMAIDYELVLTVGINGIVERIDRFLENCSEEKVTFYRCCKRCLQAVIMHSENYATFALEMSKQTLDEERRNELIKISEICKKVPANPAETFYEAVQSVHFVSHCLNRSSI